MEKWKEVPGYEGFYEASNHGNVRSLDRTVKKSGKYDIAILGKMLKPYHSKDGYLCIKIYNGNRNAKSIKVHRVICLTFIPNPENKPTVNHINGIKSDNRIQNLEWATRSEQKYHAYNLGLSTPMNGTKHPSAKLTEYKVKEMRALYNDGTTKTQLSEKYGVCFQKISRVIRGLDWRHVQ